MRIDAEVPGADLRMAGIRARSTIWMAHAGKFVKRKITGRAAGGHRAVLVYRFRAKLSGAGIGTAAETWRDVLAGTARKLAF